jgi:enoyl-CoA hydratase
VIGLKQAKELLLTGDDHVSAERALAIAANDRAAVAVAKQAINRGAEIMGMRQGLLQGLEMGVFAEASETPESREFNEILEKEGAKAALAWQEARLARETAAEE